MEQGTATQTSIEYIVAYGPKKISDRKRYITPSIKQAETRFKEAQKANLYVDVFMETKVTTVTTVNLSPTPNASIQGTNKKIKRTARREDTK